LYNHWLILKLLKNKSKYFLMFNFLSVLKNPQNQNYLRIKVMSSENTRFTTLYNIYILQYIMYCTYTVNALEKPPDATAQTVCVSK